MAPGGYGDIFLRLAIAVVAGAIIGLDRELRKKPAGLRTFALVSLGSAAFVLQTGAGTSADAVSRIVQGIVTGVGFLGAGSIIRGRREESVRGLTTAASIWLAAAVGIASGLANWPLVAAGTVLGVVILLIDPVERVIHERAGNDPKDAKGGS